MAQMVHLFEFLSFSIRVELCSIQLTLTLIDLLGYGMARVLVLFLILSKDR